MKYEAAQQCSFMEYYLLKKKQGLDCINKKNIYRSSAFFSLTGKESARWPTRTVFLEAVVRTLNLLFCRPVSVIFHPVFNFPASVLEGCTVSGTTSLLHFSHMQSPISVLENALTKLTFCNIFNWNRFKVNLDYNHRRHQTP